MKYEKKLEYLRRKWKLADPGMRLIIEKRARALKLAGECSDPEQLRIISALS